ncbi:hypothetical protein [Nostoc sp. CMAA1605]|uniref:hypothetical protein n=1 Tax=Nostoc sp. CMAA1605 TaxID=2055159 RepID=UPI001F340AD1|nr:hypothetical protein [Nostoc sp. CMAA1605]MCF4968063.1 hypothetical protein [Nostoc sp. CMAA1605]
MNESSNLFNLLNSEEAAIVSGGFNINTSNSDPMFAFSPENPTQEGVIKNADGRGKDVSVPLSGGAKNSSVSNGTVKLADLAIPSQIDITSL